ncbi:MAG: methyltransferase domain-containing protein [Magnetococcales bacterium]|nr:methyltransferase domain-containing protein [Magnetococcales bacterium]
MSIQNFPVGVIQEGIVRFGMQKDDDQAILYYRRVGGAHFYERSQVAFAMSALDTHVYHGHLRRWQPSDSNVVIVDVGGGDGRNARPWLEMGFQRVVVVDCAAAALLRFRNRVADQHPEWLPHLLLVECDARLLPLISGCAGLVQAIESLGYLTEDYGLGFAECCRLVARSGHLIVAERDREAEYMVKLFYEGGVAGMVEYANGKTVVHENATAQLQGLCFTEEELNRQFSSRGFHVVESRGVSLLSLVLGYLRTQGHLQSEDERWLQAVQNILANLGDHGRQRRSHFLVGMAGDNLHI